VVQGKGQAHAQPAHAGRHVHRTAERRHGVPQRVLQLTFVRIHGRPYIYVYVNVNCPQSNEMNAARSFFTIAELAAEFDVTPRAIRFYEDTGLLEPTRAGRNRVYSQRDRTHLKLTLRGKRLGLSLSEILHLVRMYDSEADTAPQLQAFLAVLQSHRAQLEQQQDDIRVMLREINQHEQRCERLLATAAISAAHR
jgi:DNA-binding transcriptional MerR regulator